MKKSLVATTPLGSTFGVCAVADKSFRGIRVERDWRQPLIRRRRGQFQIGSRLDPSLSGSEIASFGSVGQIGPDWVQVNIYGAGQDRGIVAKFHRLKGRKGDIHPFRACASIGS